MCVCVCVLLQKLQLQCDAAAETERTPMLPPPDPLCSQQQLLRDQCGGEKSGPDK